MILVLVLLPVMLLTIPLAFRAGGIISPGELRLEAGGAWGWGLLTANIGIRRNETLVRLRLVGLPIPVPGRKPGKARDGNLRKKDGRDEKKDGRDGKKDGFSLFAVSTVLNRKLINAVFGYIKRLLGSLRVRLRLSGVFGTDDPALTGVILALIAALRADNTNLDLNADFSGPILDVAGEISGRVVPIVILWLTMRLLLAGPVRKLWWAWLKSKLIRKKFKEVVQHV